MVPYSRQLSFTQNGISVTISVLQTDQGNKQQLTILKTLNSIVPKVGMLLM